MDEPPFAGDLLDQVEIVAVAGQHRDARSGSGQKDQRVVEASIALMRLETLGTGQSPRDNPGGDPYVRIGAEYPIGRDGIQNRYIMVALFAPTRMCRIRIADAGGQFSEAHGIVEKQGGIDNRTRRVRKCSGGAHDINVRIDDEPVA